MTCNERSKSDRIQASLLIIQLMERALYFNTLFKRSGGCIVLSKISKGQNTADDTQFTLGAIIYIEN